MSGSIAVTESEFYMWRAVFAIAHADNKVTDEEVRFMAEAMEDIAFSEGQKAVLKDDIRHPKDITEMFKGITNPKDQSNFFRFARNLVWVDGEFGKEEQAIMLELQKAHLQNIDVDTLIGNIDLQLEDSAPGKRAAKTEEPKARKIVFSFREKFLKDRIKKDDQS